MTNENSPAAPAASVAASTTEVPDDILKKIKHAWIAALISAGVTLIITLIVISGTDILGFSGFELFDVALILGLGFGIYKKSRTCAVLMLLYFIASKILLIAETGGTTGLPMALVFAYYYWQGVSGTFAYHSFKKRQFAPTLTRG